MDIYEKYKAFFINYLKKEKRYSQNTFNSYVLDVSYFIDYLKENNIENPSSVSKSQISRYISYISKQGKSSSTIARHISSIKLFYNALLYHGHVKTNPCEDIKPPKQDKKMPDILTPEEVNTLLSSPDITTQKGIRDKAMLELLYATGMKVSEITSMRRKDINTQMGYCICSYKDKNRLIPIGESASKALENYFSSVELSQDSFIFGKNGTEPFTRQALWKMIKHYGKKAEIEKEITPATLRHSFAAHMIYNGADLSSVQEMLGLSNINSIDVYSKLNKKRILDVYNAYHPRA